MHRFAASATDCNQDQPGGPSPSRDLTVLGIDVGGSKLALVEGRADGVVLQRTELANDPLLPFDLIFSQIVAALEGLVTVASGQSRTVGAISVSVGGPLKIQEGQLLNPPNLPLWHDVPLKKRLEHSFPDIPVYVEHDAKAGALAEFRFGVGLGRTDLAHLVFLTFGTGLGAGFIVNRQVLYGASDSAGEVGHWRMARSGPIGFGKAGSWEGFASGAGMLALAKSKFPERWGRDTNLRALVDCMLQDDPDALIVASEIGEWLGRGIALIVDAFNPQAVVLGKLAYVLGERVLKRTREVVIEEALPMACSDCVIVPSALGQSIGDIAALMAALTRDKRFASL